MPLTSSSGLQVVVSPSPSLLAQARLWNGKNIAVEQDKHLRANILRLKGEVSTTKLQLPRDDRPISSLSIGHYLVVAQVLLDNSEHFAIEFTVSQSAVARLKLIVGTQYKEAQSGSTNDGLPLAKLPLIIPRGKWVQVVLHLSGIVGSIFNMGSVKCIDAIGFSGTARIAKVFATSDEQAAIDCAPSGMVLFAVPAYAPPIWTTAGVAPNSGKTNATRTQQQPPTTGESLESPHRAGYLLRGAAPPSAASDMGVMGISLSGSGTSPTKAPRGQSVPPRLQPIDPLPAAEAARPQSESGNAQAGNGNWYPNGAIPRQPPLDQPSAGPCKYVRFVENDGTDQRSQGRGQFGQGGAANRGGGGGAGAAEAPDISGWETSNDEEPAQTDNVATPSPLPAKTEMRVPKQPGKPKNATDERLQRLIASRKRKVEIPSTSRRQARGTEDDDVSSPGRRRRQRAKRRMQLLRQNEQKSAKQSALRFAQASEMALNRNVANFEDGTARTVEDGEPVCGYGFGYLGLLNEDGSYEPDEGANTRLRGALTLELSGDFDSGE